MKRKIELWDEAGHILSSVGKGVLLTAAADGKVNTMTIGWGTLGIEWSKPIFIAFVRESRYTKELLDKNPEFTVNIPYGEYDKSILGICGTRSGRDMDKIKELGLTLEPSETVSVPGIRELPLTLECKVIYKQEQDEHAINEENTQHYYPKEGPQQKGDYHTAYYGQVTAAYIIE
ncbi:MAG: flavin reductase family protein [Oscillospiraceae bacterium]|nr:flavin reductase family protein [Oscillospiraceae bacterium]